MNSVDKHSNLDQSSVRPTSLRKMTEKGREFTLEVAKEPEEINEITNQQHEVQNSWEKIFADASYRLERLELKEEIRSNSSRGSRKSKFSRLSSKSSSSSKSALLGMKAS